MVWWRRGPGWSLVEDSSTYRSRTVKFDRVSLDLTSLRDVGEAMVRLSQGGAELRLIVNLEPVDLARLDNPSDADLIHLSLQSARVDGGTMVAPDHGRTADDYATIGLTTGEQSYHGALHVQCGNPDRLDQVTRELTRMILAVGRPLPTAAGWPWAVAGIGSAVLAVFPVIAAITGDLPLLLVAPTLVLAAIGCVALFRWARPTVKRLHWRRSVILIDALPRREVRLRRANHLRDLKVAALSFASGLLLAVIAYLLAKAGGK